MFIFLSTKIMQEEYFHDNGFVEGLCYETLECFLV